MEKNSEWSPGWIALFLILATLMIAPLWMRAFM